MNKKFIQLIGLGLVIGGLTILCIRQGYLMDIQRSLQNRFYDFDNPSQSIVLVAIDEKSLKKEALGPLNSWRRNDYAKALKIMREAGAKVIGLDVTFPDESSFGAADDQSLAAAIEAEDDVVLAGRYYFENGAKQVEWPNETLLSVKPTVGWLNVQLDEDGFVRQLPVLMEHQGEAVEAFSLQIVRKYLKAEGLTPQVKDSSYAFTPEILIPVTTHIDRQKGITLHTMYINYAAAPHRYPRVSFSDVLASVFKDQRGNPVDFKNKIVLVGPTALDLKDDYLSPVSEGLRMAGVEIHANAIHTLLEERFLKDQSRLSLLIELLVLLALDLFLFSRLRVFWALPLAILAAAGFLVAGFIGYTFQLFLNVVYPLLVILLSFVGVFLLRFTLEQKQRRFMKQAFSRYVNKEVVEEIIKNPKLLELGGVKKEVTIFFSDIQGSTSIAESMSPDGLAVFLNDYFKAMTEAILAEHGTLDKYEGDAVMAFWGAPLPSADHAKRACQAALLQQEKLRQLNEQWQKQSKPMIRVRMGINTGPAIVGNMGSLEHFNYTVMGDSVNLASRLEGINKQYGTLICLSEFTYEQVKDTFVCRELDRIRVKGKQIAVRIYELVGAKDQVPEALLSQIRAFEDALRWYRERKFMEAKEAFKKLSGSDPVARVFMTRCDTMSKNPPASDWDGVWVFTEK